MNQYSAKLLFQWRPVRNGKSRKRRVCEERIVTFPARSPKSALSKAKRIGRSEEFTDSRDGADIFFEFVGVLELMDVSISYDEGEVWWELVERVQPSERRASLIPPEHELEALRKDLPNRRKLRPW